MSALPHWCTYAFLTTMLSKASILVSISSFTLRELSFPLDMLTKLIVYCSQHVRTAGFALDCKMFGKPHASSEAGSVPSVPTSAAAFAFAQNAGSCPDEPEQRRVSASDWPNSTGFHVTMAKIFLAATGTDFPAEMPGTLLPTDKPAGWVSQWVWPGHVPVVPFSQPRGDYSSSWQQYCPWKHYNREGRHAPPLLEKKAIFSHGPVLQISPTRNGSNTWLLTDLLQHWSHEQLLNVAEMQIIIF